MHLYEQVIDKQVDEIVYPSKFKRKDKECNNFTTL